MNMKKTIRLTLISITILSYNANLLSYRKLLSAFGGTPYQERIEKEYPLNEQRKLFIENIHGNITIKTDWQKKSVALIANIRKKYNKDSVDIIEDTTDPKTFTLRTAHNDKKNKASVDLLLIVPQDIKLQLATSKGNIDIQNTHAITMANTEQGNINLSNIHNKAYATTGRSGSIYCTECTGPLTANTNRGNIIISNAQNSVISKTHQGRIHIKCSNLPKDCTIDAASIWGNIALYLPVDCNADVKATTEKGTCICEHYITLRPQTTKLNNSAWNKFRRTVDGTIGAGHTPVHVSSVSSNIRIMANRS